RREERRGAPDPRERGHDLVQLVVVDSLRRDAHGRLPREDGERGRDHREPWPGACRARDAAQSASPNASESRAASGSTVQAPASSRGIRSAGVHLSTTAGSTVTAARNDASRTAFTEASSWPPYG